MTTGSTLDNWDGTSGGLPFGFYHSKDWSGQDRTDALPLNTEHGYICTYKERLLDVISYKLISPTVFVKSAYWADPQLPKLSSYPSNRAVGKVWDQLSQSKFNAGVFAGEFRETVDFISGTITALAKSVAHVRNGRFKRAIRSLLDRPPPPKVLFRRPKSQDNVGLLANNWLSYYYALLPLLNDIVAAYEYLRHDYEIIKVLKVSAVDEFAYPITVNHCTWNYEGKAVYEIRGEVLAKLSTADRLGLTDPVSVAWELTKLSFVVDWLIPVGTFLKAANASRRCEMSRLFVTKAIIEKIWNPVCTSGVGFTWLVKVPPSNFNRRSFVQRIPLTTLPVSLPAIENPLGLSYQKYVTASALLSQAFGKR